MGLARVFVFVYVFVCLFVCVCVCSSVYCVCLQRHGEEYNILAEPEHAGDT